MGENKVTMYRHCLSYSVIPKVLGEFILLPTQVKWLLSPIILTFVILPMILLTLIYVSSLSLYIYQAHRKRLIR